VFRGNRCDAGTYLLRDPFDLSLSSLLTKHGVHLTLYFDIFFCCYCYFYPFVDNGAAASVNSRRNFFQKGAALAVGVAVGAPVAANAYAVPDLPYPFEGLEPIIDTPTMKLHHDKHHATYVANINKATEGKPEKPIVELMESAIDAGPAFRNSGGGHYNHAFFWEEMAPPDEAKKTKPSEQLDLLITKSFGSMDEMKAEFEAKAAPGAVFGSGWVWLCVNKAGDGLSIVGTPNQVRSFVLLFVCVILASLHPCGVAN
jgi:Fe-Mn family superoxide dismutase